jgi:hypothetical protein
MATQLLNQAQQRFVDAIIAGKSNAEAYRAARFPTGGSNITQGAARKGASKLMAKASVRDALARAQARAAERAELSVDHIVEQLLEAREIALAADPPQVSAAVSASVGVARLLGLWIDRSELTVIRSKPSPVPTGALELDETEWRRLFDPSYAKSPPAEH